MSNKEKIEACIFLASYLDTIGYYNSAWEFNFNNSAQKIIDAQRITYDILFQFYIMGGPSKINVSNWIASDDTILLMATTKALINGGGELNYIKEYKNIYNLLNDGKRTPGVQTMKSLKHLFKITEKEKESYLYKIPTINSMGGNGAAIRTATIGIMYHNDIDKIIEESITASRITHNYPLGFLGGMVSALFTSYSFNNIKPWLWIDMLLELHETNRIKKYIHTTDLSNFFDSKIDEYFLYWYKYKEERFNNIMNYRNKKDIFISSLNLNQLSEYIPEFKQNYTGYDKLGFSGIDSVIYAYDALLLSIVPSTNQTENNLKIDLNNIEYSFESILFFGCLHVGDSDSTGAILGAWYGSLNGYNGFDKNKMKQLEFYDQLKILIDNMIKIIK